MFTFNKWFLTFTNPANTYSTLFFKLVSNPVLLHSDSRKQMETRTWKQVTETKSAISLNLMHCFVNVYFLFSFGKNLENSWICFKKENLHSTRHFHKEACSVLCFNIRQYRKPCSHWYAVTNNERNLRVKLVVWRYLSIWWHQSVQRFVVLKVCFEISLSWSSMMCRLFLSAVIKSKQWQLYPYWILPSVMEVVLKISFQFLQNLSDDLGNQRYWPSKPSWQENLTLRSVLNTGGWIM